MTLEACSMSASQGPTLPDVSSASSKKPEVHRSLSTKLEDTRLEILGRLAGENPPDTVTSSELVE